MLRPTVAWLSAWRGQVRTARHVVCYIHNVEGLKSRSVGPTFMAGVLASDHVGGQGGQASRRAGRRQAGRAGSLLARWADR